MPQRNRLEALPPQERHHHHHHHDPLAACLDADGTYICTAYNSRCYIIQKVTPGIGGAHLNPDADIFHSKVKESDVHSYEIFESDYTALEGSVYMNGDVGKLPSGAVYAATPDAHAPSPTADFSIINGVGEAVDSVSEGGAAPMGQAPPPPDSAPDPNNPPNSMPLDQLKQMLSSQLEYYFSRENLANDAYLISQMDNDQYVPIWTVANFNQVKKLTTDIKLITEVLRESPNVQVDEEGQKVRPNHKRCIVILREIPDSTPLEEVKALFSGKGCPKLISCEFAHNNSWYVTFENDEDAQKAYRFLREEVKEFQGKPIMARIKAKPMNRLPMPPVAPGMGGMKNGYRTPPASASSATVFDPSSAFPQGQQRFLYTNGTSLPHNVNYTNQVQIYTFQHQPFYPPSMLPHWGATTPAYFDIGSVFSVNGLAPQGPFGKTHNTRFMPRNRNKRSSGLEQRTSLSDSGLLRGSHSAHSITPKSGIGSGGGGGGGGGGGVKIDTTCTNTSASSSVTTKPHYYSREVTQTETNNECPLPPPAVRSHDTEDPYRVSQPASKESLPPRRRRKEDEVQSRSGGSPGPQFDLEADAFPPLPGLEPQLQQAQVQVQAQQLQQAVPPLGPQPHPVSAPVVAPPTTPKPPPPPVEPLIPEQAPPQSAQWVESRTVPGAVNNKSCMPEKLTKTDENASLVNGSGGDAVSSSRGNEVISEIAIAEPKQASPPVPPSPFVSAVIEPSNPTPMTFNNSSTTAQHLPAQSPSDLGVVRLSYAQVAQHHHKEKADREKQQVMAGSNVVQNITPILPPEEEKKEVPVHHQSKVADSVMSTRGRGGARAAPRRRDNLPRFNSRQRSPK